MTVGELILRLSAYNPSLEISITDGWSGAIYEGAFPIHLVTVGDDTQMIDIGIGGYQLEEER